jgi:hypothetical protein
VVVIVRLKVASSRGVDRACCVGRVIDAIVDGTEDCAGVRLAVVDSAVWVGAGRGGLRELCHASLSELRGVA